MKVPPVTAWVRGDHTWTGDTQNLTGVPQPGQKQAGPSLLRGSLFSFTSARSPWGVSSRFPQPNSWESSQKRWLPVLAATPPHSHPSLQGRPPAQPSPLTPGRLTKKPHVPGQEPKPREI